MFHVLIGRFKGLPHKNCGLWTEGKKFIGVIFRLSLLTSLSSMIQLFERNI